MKKILLTLGIIMTMLFCANAQYGQSDAFFNNWDDNDDRLDISEGFSFVLPGTHGYMFDTNGTTTPLGSGLLVLATLGAGYAASKRKSVHAE